MADTKERSFLRLQRPFVRAAVGVLGFKVPGTAQKFGPGSVDWCGPASKLPSGEDHSSLCIISRLSDIAWRSQERSPDNLEG